MRTDRTMSTHRGYRPYWGRESVINVRVPLKGLVGVAVAPPYARKTMSPAPVSNRGRGWRMDIADHAPGPGK